MGFQVRLLCKLEKERGSVNGAIRNINTAIACGICIVKRSSCDMVLVQPLCENGIIFLPCVYGYASLIRRAKGASLFMGALFLAYSYPTQRG